MTFWVKTMFEFMQTEEELLTIHHMNIEQEERLTNMLAEEIGREIDLILLDELPQICVVNWQKVDWKQEGF